MSHAWKITADRTQSGLHLDPGESFTGVIGPGNAPQHLIKRLSDGEGQKFRLYDADDKLCFEGLFITTGSAEGEEKFSPLDDFGLPDAGCTRIDYFNKLTGRYYSL